MIEHSLSQFNVILLEGVNTWQKKNKKHELNGIQKVLAGIRQDRYMLDQRERDTQYECTHKRGNSLRLKQTKTEGVFRCKECGAKLDFRFLMKNSDPETIKAELKDWKKLALTMPT